ncbi:uncharacterized protein MKK02DRAFT_36365 [Dioszegia hungarica]|uniref:Uncharacterized protein n=1 Tax=Dioszegia hungarica TaxID=4972 RepID=A0AA38LXH3_9TREE|nr:uncharacterized protein MKK02DRAFT_36365 [Dioszegia hungarica]KAI9637351.1 hypothetical protein MKK02DRAFT_36365 [Dioszegia hungarica]
MTGAMATKSEIREHPSKQGVTVAASGKELEADVQRKMKVWGVIEAFRDGRMPDNKQIDAALAYAQKASPVDLNKLSPEGRVLVDDTRDIIETLRAMVHEKNADELFQNALYTSVKTDVSHAKQSGVVPISKEDAKADGETAAKHLRVLLTLFVTNAEVRKLAKDLGFVGRDIFASTASRAADKARPSQQQLDQVDREAPSKQWIGADGKKLGPNDTPELQMKGPDGAEVRYNPKDAPSQAKVTDTQGNTHSAGGLYDKAQQKKEEVRQTAEQKANEQGGSGGIKEQLKSHAQDVAGNRDPNASLSQQKDQVLGAAQNKADHAQNQAQSQAQNDSRAPNNAEDAKNQARDKANQLKEKIPEEHRQKISDELHAQKEIIQDAFPEERREQFIYRLKKVLVELQEHKDYREAMTWLLDTFDNYKGAAEHVAHKATNAADGVASDGGVQDATLRFRRLLERFANGQSLDGVYNALDQMYRDTANDPKLKNWWSHANDYVHRVLLEPGFVLEDEADKEGRQLQEGGKEFFDDKYKKSQETLFEELQRFFTAFAEDPLNQRLGDDVKRLTKDLLFNEDGNLAFKPHLWNDLRVHFLPAVIRQIGYVPIPRAEYEDDKIAVVIENLILSGPNLFPNVVTLEANNRVTFSPYENINKTLDTHHHKMRLGMSQIQADIRDVAFSFKRKSGWPKLSDHGLADVIISGKGISIDAEIESVEHRRNDVFKVNHVTVEIDNMTWKIRDSKHDILYKFLKATATGIIKKAIQAAVKVALTNALEEGNSQLAQVRNTAAEARKSNETNQREAIKELYKRKAEKAEREKEAAKDHTGTFRIVTNQESMLNPEMTHSDGKSIIKRLAKTEDLSHSGSAWRSPAFSLTDSKHPAVTGEHHPQAVAGAAHGKGMSSAIPAPGASGNQGPAGK